MAGTLRPTSILRFDRYEVDLRAGSLSKGGVRISLREKSFQILVVLLENAGDVVTREELRQRLWPNDVFVDFDNNLNTAVGSLRQALHDSAEHPRFIETIHKRGYRFLAAVSEAVPAIPRSAVSRTKILVLPFVNLSGDPAQEYFSDAMTDEIITALAGLAPECLAVIARTTAMYYKGRHKDVARIRRELGMDYLVEGAVRRNDDQVNINIQLIQTSDQTHLFAKKYAAPLQQIFDLQNCIAQTIVAHVPEAADKIRAGEPAGNRITRKPTEDLVAYNFYLQGREHYRHATPDPATVTAKAMRYYEDAVARDPQFALAYAGIAEIYGWIGFLGVQRPKEAFAAGLKAALRAVEIDPALGYAHALVSKFRGCLEYDRAEADREMALALELDPRCPETRFHYGNFLLGRGRIQEAVAEFEQGLESDPLSLFFRFWLGYAFYVAGNYARALEQFRFLIELAPEEHTEMRRALDLGYTGLGLIRAAEGRLNEAVSAFRRAVEVSDGVLMRLGQLGVVLARNRNTAEAHALLERVKAISAKTYFPPTCVAWIYLGLGDIDSAFPWLERAVEDRDPNVFGIIFGDPFVAALAPLHADPRCAALLRKMNLEA